MKKIIIKNQRLRLLIVILMIMTISTQLFSRESNQRNDYKNDKDIDHIQAFLKSNNLFTSNNTLNEFSTDGCSSFPDGLLNGNEEDEWLHCCIIHDIDYWLGGTKVSKRNADLTLKACVNKSINVKNNYFSLGELMYRGVQDIGRPNFFGTPSIFEFRWSYGSENHFFYEVLNQDELIQALKKITKLKYNVLSNQNSYYQVLSFSQKIKVLKKIEHVIKKIKNKLVTK